MSTPEQILRTLLDDIVKDRNYRDPKIDIKPISTGGANYTSVLFAITVSEPGNEDLQLFAKVGTVGEKIRSEMPLNFFDIERHAYEDLLKKYEKIQEDHKVPISERLRIPKFYGHNANLFEETIVLEDLAVQGFTTYDRLKSVDWDYASKSVQALARFHALSIAYSEENPEEYNKLLEIMKFDKDTFVTVMEATFGKLKATALNGTWENNKEKLEKYLDNNVTSQTLIKFYLSNPRNILCHGDYRASNLMHRLNEDGTLEVIPVDYQTLRASSPLIDLMSFIFMGSDENFRRRHFWDLIDHYYRELCSALRNLNLDPNKIYPEDEYDLDVKEFLPFGLLVGLFSLPIITVDAEDAPSLGGENDFATFLEVKTGAVYSERLNGIINDFIRWGII
ncbi:uncharacterized protein LOC131842060 [Achroia grisella]|uniref:uncharacterized protein LOC131842060 n=1 Tax=Achroia grisella TaxID=688607 RepID=UPI0027D20D92|nr:uncharacterized protein LOC131842060 [Achroia grisella]